MKRLVLGAAALTLLVACGEDVTDEPGGTPAPGAPSDVPEVLAGDLESVTYNAGSDTLSVDMYALDTTPETAVYTRNAALDVPGYMAFSVQEDPLDRMFVAMYGRSDDGTVTATVVSDGGQFNAVFGGTTYARIGAYSPRTAPGLASYAGDYVGLQNTGAALSAPVGTPVELLPGAPSRVTGSVFINADFVNNALNGAIYDRRIVGSNEAQASLFLIPTPISGSGTFTGSVENRDQDTLGTYGGIFGGAGATSVAGSLYIDNFDDSVDNEREFGIFVLGGCGQAGAPAVCSIVNP